MSFLRTMRFAGSSPRLPKWWLAAAIVEPAIVEPAIVEPAVVEPVAVEPVAVEPAVIKPEVSPHVRAALAARAERLKQGERAHAQATNR